MKTIATALGGDSIKGLQKLPSQITAASNIHEDLLGKNYLGKLN